MGSIQAIQSYNSDASTLLSVNEHNQLRVILLPEKIWRWIQALFIGKASAYSDCRAEKIAKAIQHIVHHEQLRTDHTWAYVDCMRRLQGRVKKEPARTQLAAAVKQVALRALEPKRALVAKAISHLKSNYESTATYSQALHFLKSCKRQIKEAKRTPLPLWFHATPNEGNLSSILWSQRIRQNHAIRGYGAYVSSSDEAGQIIGYGRYTFALDDDEISPNSAAYFVPNPENNFVSWGINRLFGWQCPSIWVRVHSDLTIQERSVAYISYPAHEEVTDQPSRTQLQQQYPWIRWINRDTSNKICEVFRAVTKRSLPNHWQQLQHTPHSDLPDHFK